MPAIEVTVKAVAVLSIDLAYRRWSDLGVVILNQGHPPQARLGAAPPGSAISCEMIPFAPPGVDPARDADPIGAEILAGRLNHLANLRGIRVMMLDGPQAWKSKSNGLEHARVSERQLNTAGKTGLPGMVRPITYRPFAEFCIDVWDALCRRGWRRLETREHSHSPQERVLVESYPYAAWKSLGLKPLCSKRRARVSDLAEASAALCALIPLSFNRTPNHDQLQAIVGGLPGLALEEHNTGGVRIVGKPPRREEGHWREGFIVLPVAPRAQTTLRWLN
ncbi:MAG: hypothetical protein WBE72_00580 [Terracidiphilus sp.]